MIYLDNHSTTPCDPRVIEEMLPYFFERYGNPASPHSIGNEGALAVKEARKRVANLIGAEIDEVVFTSGATESNNLVILGITAQHKSIGGKRRRIVTSLIEHKSVIEPCKYLAEEGWEVIFLPVGPTGIIDFKSAEEAINEETLLVTIQAANSEIGTIQPIKELSALSNASGAIFHCDAAQAVGKIPLNVVDWQVDLLSISAHKLYGPKGVGALYIRGGSKKLPLKPIIKGGNQEWGIRPGTAPVPLIVGLGKACEITFNDLLEENNRLQVLRDSLESLLTREITSIKINGSKSNRLPNNSNITFPGLDAEILLANLPLLALSTGSACESGSIEPSRTLTSIGLSREEAFCTIRFGIGRFNSHEEIIQAVELIKSAFTKIKEIF